MKNRLTVTFKVILTIVLSLIVVGIALASIFGFNNVVDYKDSYEVVVGINQKIDDKAETAKITAEKYFEAKGVTPVEYFTQKVNEGSKHVYKFESKTNIDVNDLKATIEKAVNDESIAIICEVNEVKDVSQKAPINVVWVLAIAIVFGLVYLAFTEKFASALSVALTSITSSVLFVALLGLTRIPVYPYLSMNLLVTFALTLVLSTVLARRYKEIINLGGEESFDKSDVVKKAAAISLKRFVLFGIVGLIFSVAITICGSYLSILGIQFVVSIICSLVVSYGFMPIFWLSFKKVK